MPSPAQESGFKRTALVTGASAGIGDAFAEVFAAAQFNLVVVARREDRLRMLAERLTARHGVAVHVIPLDLSQRDAVVRLTRELASRGISVDALVNNAGYGVAGTYAGSPWERHDAFLQVLVVSLAELTHRLLPGMIERGYGRIVNVASLAGLVPSPAGHTLYGAAKAFVIKFSESLSHEVRRHNIHVTALCPGFTLSEFHDVSGTREMVKRLPSWMWMDAATVARQGFEAVMNDNPLCVTGRLNRAIVFLVRHLPQSLITAAGRRAGRAYRKT